MDAYQVATLSQPLKVSGLLAFTLSCDFLRIFYKAHSLKQGQVIVGSALNATPYPVPFFTPLFPSTCGSDCYPCLCSAAAVMGECL